MSTSTFPGDVRKLLSRCPRYWFFGFNRQFYRAGIILPILKKTGIGAFIETGTHMGDTCLLVAAQTHLPIFSCENNPEYYQAASSNLLAFGDRIKLSNMDSRSFLRYLVDSRKLTNPFFYLDAHWDADWPLLGELELILASFDEFVVLIDDFKIDSDDGFGYDTYNGVALDESYIEATCTKLRSDLCAFYPSYPSSIETGYRRGWVLIASPQLAENISKLVPDSLIRSRRLGAHGADV